MKTAEQYAKISLKAVIVQVVFVGLTILIPNKYDWPFVVVSLAAAGVAIWAILKEAKAKKQVPAPEFTKEDVH